MALLALFFFLSIILNCNALSTKKALCVSPKKFMCHDLDHFTNIHTWYNWGLQPIDSKMNCTNLKSGHIPMQWGKWFNANSFTSLPSDANILMGFNEPNHMSQANLTPLEAATRWRKLEEYNPGRILVSPAAAPCGQNCNIGDAKLWFIEFFNHCRGCRVDILATHAYWCNPTTTMNYLNELWTLFNKPIWLTEFSCPETHSAQTQLQYMKAILPLLEATDYVEKYFWFTHRFNGTWITSSTSLVEQNSNTLTELGQYYNSY